MVRLFYLIVMKWGQKYKLVKEKCKWHRLEVWGYHTEKISTPECCVNYCGWSLVAASATRWSWTTVLADTFFLIWSGSEREGGRMGFIGDKRSINITRQELLTKKQAQTGAGETLVWPPLKQVCHPHKTELGWIGTGAGETRELKSLFYKRRL